MHSEVLKLCQLLMSLFGTSGTIYGLFVQLWFHDCSESSLIYIFQISKFIGYWLQEAMIFRSLPSPR